VIEPSITEERIAMKQVAKVRSITEQELEESTMKRRTSYLLWLLALIGGGVLVAPLSPSHTSSVRRPQTIQSAGRGAPWINLKDGEDLPAAYVGRPETQSLMADAKVEPMALASADFDEDGMPDLISAYAAPGGGVITLHRGNVESVYPKHTPEQLTASSNRPVNPSSFHPEARIFELPQAPDFLGAGDFDNDGHWDVVAASRGSNVLQFLPGDGHGGFGAGKSIPLPGGVTAMTVGEINRADGIADVIVGVIGDGGPQVLVFEGPEGALKAKPEVFASKAEVTALALGQLDDNAEYDLAIAAGQELMIVHGRDRKLSLDEAHQAEVVEAKVDRRNVGFNIASLAIGDFIWDRAQRTDLALLSGDGAVHMLARGELDRRPWTEAELQETRQGAKSAEETKTTSKQTKSSRKRPSASMAATAEKQAARNQAWQEMTVTPVLQSASPGNADSLNPQSAFGDRQSSVVMVKTRTAMVSADSLVVGDSANRQLHIVGDTSFASWKATKSASAQPLQLHTAVLSTLDTGGAPAAVLPMRLNIDALSDLVILRKGSSAPSVVLTAVGTTLTVNKTDDHSDQVCTAGHCTMGCTSDDCTLREAIEDSSNTDLVTPPVMIKFNVGGGRPRSP
jgi:CSLREA domain-containing protein